MRKSLKRVQIPLDPPNRPLAGLPGRQNGPRRPHTQSPIGHYFLMIILRDHASILK